MVPVREEGRFKERIGGRGKGQKWGGNLSGGGRGGTTRGGGIWSGGDHRNTMTSGYPAKVEFEGGDKANRGGSVGKDQISHAPLRYQGGE